MTSYPTPETTAHTDMQLQLTKDETTRTVLRIPEGRPLYHIHTPGIWSRKTTTIYKIPENNAQRYLDVEAKHMTKVEPLPEEEIARIHWHAIHNTRLIWEGKACDMKDVLKTKSRWSE